MVRKLQSFLREPIDVRRLKLLLPVATQIGIPGIIQQDVNQIGLRRGTRGRALHQAERHSKEQSKHKQHSIHSGLFARVIKLNVNSGVRFKKQPLNRASSFVQWPS